MRGKRALSRCANLLRRLCRWVGAPEVSPRRLDRFLKESGERAPLLPEGNPSSLSVVVPCYGHASYLPAMFKSLLSQSRLPDEVILVDDASTDDSRALLEAFVKRASEKVATRFELQVNRTNLGQAVSLNRGIAAATSELVMILNDDDYLMHDAVEVMLTLFARHREVALIGGHSVHFAKEGELLSAAKHGSAYADVAVSFQVRHPTEVRGYRFYNSLNMTHSGSCFLKSAWSVVGGYGEDRGRRVVPFSDRDFQLRVNALYPVGVSDEYPFSFWRNNSSVDCGINS